MTKINCLFNLVLLTLIAVITTVSCHKDDPNPPTQDLKSQVFEYSITELRQTKEFTWTSVNGYLTNGEEKINTLYATKYNEVTLKTTAPVNVSSVDPNVVCVEKINDTAFKLCYKTDGSTVIRMWNGTEGVDKIQKEFAIQGKEVIDITGLRFSYGPSKNHLENEQFVFSRYTTSRPLLRCHKPDDNINIDAVGRPTTSDFMCKQYWKPNVWNEEKQRFVPDPTRGALLYFEGLEPENASFRTVTAFESEWDVLRHLTENGIETGCFKEGDYEFLPNEYTCNNDISDFTSRPVATWATFCHDVYVVSVKIPVESGVRFYYVFRAKDEEYPTP